MEIPYTVEERPDTGLYNGKLGIWLFLASEVMLFGALFSSYILLRTGDPNFMIVPQAIAEGLHLEGAARWSSVLSVPLATINTFILIASSVTVVMSWASLRLKDWAKYRMYMLLTLLCGFGFMVVKSIEYYSKFSHHPPLLPSTSNFMGIYFTLTGLHGLHVIGGIIVFLYLLGPGAKLYKTHPQQYTNRVEVTGLYWHFVDLVWIFLFPCIYLL